jgi:hypothetical protein
MLIVDALKEYCNDVNIIVKVDSDEENYYLDKTKNVEVVDSNYELSSMLVELSLKHLDEY